MKLDRCQVKYFSNVLDEKLLFPNINQVAKIISNTRLDLNPHQIQAALFALSKPFSTGVILADEVGLGKTIEAGIILSQKWSENKKRIVVILPPNLINQWCEELNNKFFLPTFVIDNRKFNHLKKEGFENPLLRDEILVCTYNFAYEKHELFENVDWDAVVFDEAHKLLGVYKQENVMSRALRNAFAGRYKILLTATPFMNTLMELYGISTFISEKIFGDTDSFEAQYIFNRSDRENKLMELSERAKEYSVRTLRRQVKDYIHYTSRICLTNEFSLTPQEQKLYDLVSNYLYRSNLYAIHNSGRPLVERGLWKRLASSSPAIAKSLERFKTRLEHLKNEISNYINESGKVVEIGRKQYTLRDIPKIEEEINYLNQCTTAAREVKENSKAVALILALNKGFREISRLKANHKAIIFTESKVTQEYLKSFLAKNGYADKLVTINGDNSDSNSLKIYSDWLKNNPDAKGSVNSNKRAALLDYFKNHADILIATEAASEGLNMQFCSLVINYDLPWNPQRIEQRIGRCHRYGQKNDVVVMNFLVKDNIADNRVYELLRYKFKLFDGVFGTSDSVLGNVDSLDFEKRVTDIYSRCRTRDEINLAFDLLQQEYEKTISDKLKATRDQLLSEFDETVAEKFNLNEFKALRRIEDIKKTLWEITKYRLEGDFARFDDKSLEFTPIRKTILNYYANELVYGINQKERKRCYNTTHALAKKVIFDLKENLKVYPSQVHFEYPNQKIPTLENFKGKSGILALFSATIKRFWRIYEEVPLLAGFTAGGDTVPKEAFELMMKLPGSSSLARPNSPNFSDTDEDKKVMNIRSEEDYFTRAELKEIQNLFEKTKEKYIAQSQENIKKYIESERQRLRKFYEDKKLLLDLKLKRFEKKLKDKQTKAKKAKTLKEKIALDKEAREMKKALLEMQIDICTKQGKLDDDFENELKSIEKENEFEVDLKKIFVVKWRLS